MCKARVNNIDDTPSLHMPHSTYIETIDKVWMLCVYLFDIYEYVLRKINIGKHDSVSGNNDEAGASTLPVFTNCSDIFRPYF